MYISVCYTTLGRLVVGLSKFGLYYYIVQSSSSLELWPYVLTFVPQF